MILDGYKLWILLAVGLFMCSYSTVKATVPEEVGVNSSETRPEILADDIQGHENTSGRKVRQFGFPPPPPPFGFGGYRPFGGPPPPPPPPPLPGFYRGRPGFVGGGGFQHSRIVTRTRVVNRFRGGGFYG